MKGKDPHGEVSDGKEKHVIGHWRKGDFYYKMAENMAELSAIVGRKVELIGNTLEYFAQRFPSST